MHAHFLRGKRERQAGKFQTSVTEFSEPIQVNSAIGTAIIWNQERFLRRERSDLEREAVLPSEVQLIGLKVINMQSETKCI